MTLTTHSYTPENIQRFALRPLTLRSHARRAYKRFEAARRAMSLIQKRLPPGPYRAKHIARVLANMNRLRPARARAVRDFGICQLACCETAGNACFAHPNIFNECIRCGRDAITGETLEEWFTKPATPITDDEQDDIDEFMQLH